MQIESADKAAWNIAESKRNDKPVLIRYRPDLESHIGNVKYPKRLIIFWDYEQFESSGLPSKAQFDDMRQFEDAIVNTLDHDRLAVFAFSYTHAGTREWHFYTLNIQEVGGRIHSALSSFPKLPIELQVTDDPDWGKLKEVYRYCV